MEKEKVIKIFVIAAIIAIVIIGGYKVYEIQHSEPGIELEYNINSAEIVDYDNRQVLVLNLTINNVSGKYLDINWYNYTVYDSNGNQVGTTTLGDSNTNYVFYSDVKNEEYLKRGLDVGATITGYIFMEVSSNDIASLNISKPDKN